MNSELTAYGGALLLLFNQPTNVSGNTPVKKIESGDQIELVVNESGIYSNIIANTVRQKIENRLSLLKASYGDVKDTTFEISIKINMYLLEYGLAPTFINVLHEDIFSIVSEYYTNRYFYLVEVLDDGDIVFLRRHLQTNERLTLDLDFNNYRNHLTFFGPK